MSHLTKLKAQRAENKKQLFQILDLNDLQYGNMQFDLAYQYLEEVVGITDWVGELTSSKMFWKWWVNQWEIRDAHFLRYYSDQNNSWSNKVLMICYNAWHDPKELNVHISDEAYELMIKAVVNEKQTV